MNLRFLLITIVLLYPVLGGCQPERRGLFGMGSLDHLDYAERLTREKKYPEAIEEYHRHIADRSKLKDRPEWENPEFYQLIIGDLYLAQDDPQAALQAYELAHERGVAEGLVMDRYRLLASWYEKRGEFQKGADVIIKHRTKDPVLFDLMLDRLMREITAK